MIPLVKGVRLLAGGPVGVPGRVEAPLATPFAPLGILECGRLDESAVGEAGGGGWVGTNFS